MTSLVQQSTTQLALKFLLVSSTDHISPVTGATATVTIRKEGGAFAAPAGAVTEIANGWYQVAGNATDTNTLGDIILHATATGADPTDRVVATVVAFNPQAANLGLSNVSANVSQWGGATVGTVPPDAVFLHSGTAQAGAAASITLDAGASATNNLYNNCVVFIRSGTGAGQANIITTYTGSTKVATVGANWATAPDATSVFTVLAVGPVQASISGTVNANVIQWNGVAVASGYTDIADAFLNRDMSAGTDTNAHSPRNALRFLRNKWSISGTTLTVTKEDDTTTAWTATITTTSGANPITASAPTT